MPRIVLTFNLAPEKPVNNRLIRYWSTWRCRYTQTGPRENQRPLNV